MVKENYVDDRDNTIEFRKDERGKWATQKFSFVDENGNNLIFDLQNSYWSVGIAEAGEKERFEGYMVYPSNVEPAGEYKDKAYEKIYKDAQRYFEEHPEERPGDGHSRKVAYTSSYLKIQAYKHLRSRAAQGKSSSLEEVALHAEDHPDRKLCYCWEQITGEMPANASDEKVKAALSRDETHDDMKRRSEEMAESIKRGETSIKNRVAEAQSVRIDLRLPKDGVKRVIKTEPKKMDKTLSEDEKNATVNWFINKKIKDKR